MLTPPRPPTSLAFSIAILLAFAALTGCSEGDPLGSIDVGSSSGVDAQSTTDAGVNLDAATNRDATAAIDSGVDAGTSPDSGPSIDAGDCDFSMGTDPNPSRVLLLGHPFGAVTGQDGTEIRSMSIPSSGTPVDDGVRLDVGFRPKRIAFVPNGQFALVLSEDGDLASVEVSSVTSMTVRSSVSLPSALYGDLVITSDGRTAYVVGLNSVASGGISTIHIACGGILSVETSAFYSVRLASSLVLLPGETQAILLGGQATFAPADADDVRLLTRTSTGWAQIGHFDIFGDAIDAGRIALSPDGSTLLIPNGSAFSSEGAQLSVVSVSGTTLTETDRLTMFDDAREAIFSPDGSTALVSLLEPGKIVVMKDPGTGFAVDHTINGVGLADQMAMISRGLLSGRVYVPSVDPSPGSNLAMLRIDGPGMVTDLGQITLGAGPTNIPDAVAVTP